MKENIELQGIHQALKDGCKLFGRRSGGGLRYINIEKKGKVVGYGEHYCVETALKHADEDYLAGHRPYYEVYGKLYPHYLTGSSEASSQLDGYLLGGGRLNCSFDKKGQLIKAEMVHLIQWEIPLEILNQSKWSNSPVKHSNRGFLFETSYAKFWNGEDSWSTKTIKVPEGQDRYRDHMWWVRQTGFGKDIWSAIDEAFKSQEVEIPDPY